MKKLAVIIFCVLFQSILAQGQDGVYLEYNATQAETGKPYGLLKVYSKDGNSRNVLETEYKGEIRLSQTLYLKKEPEVGYMLFENKTYRKDDAKHLDDYVVRIVGTDSMNNYVCTKILLTTYPGKKEDLTLWISDGIPNLSAYISSVINNINIRKLNEALKKQNLSGLPVRIAFTDSKNSIQYDLRLAVLGKVDSDNFDLKDYKEAQFKTAEELKKENKVSQEQYDMMKQEQMRMIEMMQKKDSTKKN